MVTPEVRVCVCVCASHLGGSCTRWRGASGSAGCVCVCVCLCVPVCACACVCLTWGDLAHGGGVPVIALVAVGTLHEDGGVAETLGEHFASDVVEPHAPTCGKTRLRLH